MKKRILSILLTLALSLGLLALAPITAHAAGPVAPNPSTTWVFNGVDADGSGNYNGGSWSWDNATKTLTLTNINYTTSAARALQFYNPDGVVTLELNGANTITSTFDSGGSYNGGIYSYDLTITGSGSLNVTGCSDYGISASHLTIVDGATVAATGTAWGFSCAQFTITGGTATATGTGGTGIHSDSDFTVSGGTVTAIGNTRAIYADYSDYTVPSGLLYWVNTTTAAPGGEGTLSNGSFVINGTHKYAKLTPSAGGGGTDPVDDSAYFKLWGKTTTYLKSNFWNWILLIFCFGWIWMAF